MKFFTLPCLSSDELNKKLISNYEDKNYNNCWCKIKYQDEEQIVRLMGYRNGYYAFFDYDTHSETLLPGFQLLLENEFKILWVGKGPDEPDEDGNESKETIFGKDKEDEFKWIMNRRYDEDNSDSDSSCSEGCDCERESGEKECSEYECSDGELEFKYT